MRSFQISVPDDVIADLHARLSRARLLPDSPRRPESGLSGEYLRDLVDNWAAFDWRSRERELNEHPQFIADIDGTDIHFVHLRSDRPDAPALLVMHGWPHTFALQLEFARLLPDFHVIVPSLPGFAFSAPFDGTMTEGVMARLMHALMTEVLGYEHYLTYGEDISANVSDLIAATHPGAVQGTSRRTRTSAPVKSVTPSMMPMPAPSSSVSPLGADQMAPTRTFRRLDRTPSLQV